MVPLTVRVPSASTSVVVGKATLKYASFGVVVLLLIFRPWGLLGKPE